MARRRRRFLGWELFFVSWSHFSIGFWLGHEPEIYLGFWILRIEED